MFSEFNPKDDKWLQVMDNEGRIHAEHWKPPLDDQTILNAHKAMLFARTADIMAVSFQRQGRMFTYPPNLGQEAISAGLSLAMQKEDWLVPAFREMGAWIAKGASIKEIFRYFMGYEDGAAFKDAPKLLPFAVPIASQLLHATGIAYAIKLKKENDVVFAVVGDGGTSEGDFHEALNFAAVWKVPVVFVVQNNQFAISVPFCKQTVSVNIAVKAIAYGMPGIKVDGNDLFAMTTVLTRAAEHARSGSGPVLVEALTYRRGAHTTSDDPTKYRSSEEEEKWSKTDPLLRLAAYLSERGLWDQATEKTLIEGYKIEVERQFIEAEQEAPYKLEDVFRYTYVDIPDDLKTQEMEYRKFLKWKEAQK